MVGETSQTADVDPIIAEEPLLAGVFGSPTNPQILFYPPNLILHFFKDASKDQLPYLVREKLATPVTNRAGKEGGLN